MAIAPNFSPGGVENGWNYTIPPLLDSPDLLVVDIRPDGILGAQSYPAVFDKDFACRKSLFSILYISSLFTSNDEGDDEHDDEGDGSPEPVIQHPGVAVAVGLGSAVVGLSIILFITISIFIYWKRRKKRTTPGYSRF